MDALTGFGFFVGVIAIIFILCCIKSCVKNEVTESNTRKKSVRIQNRVHYCHPNSRTEFYGLTSISDTDFSPPYCLDLDEGFSSRILSGNEIDLPSSVCSDGFSERILCSLDSDHGGLPAPSTICDNVGDDTGGGCSPCYDCGDTSTCEGE